MSHSNFTRRDFLKSSAGLAAAGTVGASWMADLAYGKNRRILSKNDRPLIGSIGLGGQGTGIMRRAMEFGDVVAVCDVQRQHAERAREQSGGKADYEDFHKLLERNDIEAVTIGTPDHWHTAVALAALQSGKHVYCEKPLTLTIAEGQMLVDMVKKTGKTLQVGTQQRGDQFTLFGRAVATVRSGQLGKITKVTVQLPLSTMEGGPFEKQPIPDGLNWDVWQGQAPEHDYCPERCHVQFRWWYEYSGGIVTDWGAHHMDVCQWGLDIEHAGPLSIDGSSTKLPNIAGSYNTPHLVTVDYMYPGDVHVQLIAQPPGDEGVLFEGEKGRIFVNRGRITGKAIEEQDADEKLKQQTMDQVTELFQGNTARMGNHMGNFFEAFQHGKHPISDVASQHRSVSACHLGNISIRLGRKLNWDSEKELFIDDAQANAMLTREQRSPYQITI